MTRLFLHLASSSLRSLAFVLAVVVALVVLNDRAWAMKTPLCSSAELPCSDSLPCIDDDAECTPVPPAIPTFCLCTSDTVPD